MIGDHKQRSFLRKKMREDKKVRYYHILFDDVIKEKDKKY